MLYDFTSEKFPGKKWKVICVICGFFGAFFGILMLRLKKIENHHPFSQDHLRPQRNDLKNRRSAPQKVPSVKISDI